MYLMGIDKFKEFCNRGNFFGFNFRIGSKEVDIYNRGVKIYLQSENSFTSFSGCSAISTMKCETARDSTANPWSFISRLLSSLAACVALTISRDLSFSASFFVNFMTKKYHINEIKSNFIWVSIKRKGGYGGI